MKTKAMTLLQSQLCGTSEVAPLFATLRMLRSGFFAQQCDAGL
jgi:hypothetical protein